MSSHKVIAAVAQPVEIDRFEKFKAFITDEQTVKYAGRTVVVIAIAASIYCVYRNRKRIREQCFKCSEAVKSKFKKEPQDITIPEKVTTVNLNINHPLNFNVKVIKDNEPSEEGKSSELSTTTTKVESISELTKGSPSFKLTDPLPEKSKDSGWSLF